MSVLLSLDQQPRHYCHMVSRLIYHYACLIMWHTLDQHTCLKPNSYVETSRHVCCTRPPGTLVTIKFDQHACLLELHLPADMFESVACMPVTVSSYQHPCILHLHLTISHVCNKCTWPFPMSLTFTSNQKSYHSANLCLQACKSDTLAPSQHTYLL